MTIAATAGDMGGSLKDTPPEPEVYQWNGLSLAVGIGAGRFDYDIGAHGCMERNHYIYKEISVYSVETEDKSDCYGHQKDAAFSNDEWDVFGTLQIGYDRLISDRILIGAFADIDFYVDADNAFSEKLGDRKRRGPSIQGNLGLDNVWSIGGKLGFLVTPRVALYGIGGYTEARVDGSVTAEFRGMTATASIDDKLRGWFIGAGADFKLRKDVALRLEYRYADYNGSNFLKSETYGDYCPTEVSVKGDLDAQLHSVRAALVFKLGDHERHEPLK